MKKILVKSCNECPFWQSVDNEGDTVYCSQALLTETEHTYDLVPYIPPDCPLPEEPEKVKGELYTENYGDWWINLGNDVTIESHKRFDIEANARQDAMEWAEKLGVEVEG